MILTPIQNVSKIREWSEDPALAEMFRRFPPHWTQSDEQLRGMLASSFYIFDGDECRGWVALTGNDQVARHIELGICLLPGKGRRELAAKAAKQVGAWVFQTLGYEKISCQFLAHRKDLEELLGSFGFQKEALLRNHCYWKGEYHSEIVMSLLKSEFLQNAP